MVGSFDLFSILSTTRKITCGNGHYRGSWIRVITQNHPIPPHNTPYHPIPPYTIPIPSLYHPHTIPIPFPYHPRYPHTIPIPSPYHPIPPHTIPIPFHISIQTCGYIDIHPYYAMILFLKVSKCNKPKKHKQKLSAKADLS